MSPTSCLVTPEYPGDGLVRDARCRHQALEHLKQSVRSTPLTSQHTCLSWSELSGDADVRSTRVHQAVGPSLRPRVDSVQCGRYRLHRLV